LKKVKYIYSSTTQQFEPLKIPAWKKALRLFALLSAVLVTSAIVVALAFKYVGSPNEKKMRIELNSLQEKQDLLLNQLNETKNQLAELEKTDNDIYRTIFEAKPIEIKKRNGNLSIDENLLAKKLQPLDNKALFASIELQMKQLKNRIETQATSYDTIKKYIANNQQMLSSIPSIQPISNKDLTRIASGFGGRIDPIYKFEKFHAGLDFTAPQGTPIYATGNATVEIAEYSTTGYGNNIWLNHGYSYRTHYCHMLKLSVSKGQQVKRGQVIGYVGSTGKSTGPHCHYEVERKGEKIDPIHFFYNDLTPAQFEQLVIMAAQSNQSFD
jgi:murein DD-endopeptidase MepM/ murein hydrolase activator NlpD